MSRPIGMERRRKYLPHCSAVSRALYELCENWIVQTRMAAPSPTRTPRTKAARRNAAVPRWVKRWVIQRRNFDMAATLPETVSVVRRGDRRQVFVVPLQGNRLGVTR